MKQRRRRRTLAEPRQSQQLVLATLKKGKEVEEATISRHSRRLQVGCDIRNATTVRPIESEQSFHPEVTLDCEEITLTMPPRRFTVPESVAVIHTNMELGMAFARSSRTTHSRAALRDCRGRPTMAYGQNLNRTTSRHRYHARPKLAAKQLTVPRHATATICLQLALHGRQSLLGQSAAHCKPCPCGTPCWLVQSPSTTVSRAPPPLPRWRAGARPSPQWRAGARLPLPRRVGMRARRRQAPQSTYLTLTMGPVMVGPATWGCTISGPFEAGSGCGRLHRGVGEHIEMQFLLVVDLKSWNGEESWREEGS